MKKIPNADPPARRPRPSGALPGGPSRNMASLPGALDFLRRRPSVAPARAPSPDPSGNPRCRELSDAKEARSH